MLVNTYLSETVTNVYVKRTDLLWFLIQNWINEIKYLCKQYNITNLIEK